MGILVRAINRICRPAITSRRLESIAFQGSAADLTPIAGGTGAQYQDEITAGVEHEFAHNLILTGHFVYRDLRRIIEDTVGYQCYPGRWPAFRRQYVIANPSASLDIYQNAFPCTVGTPQAAPQSGFTRLQERTPTNPSVPMEFPTASPIPAVSINRWK